MTKTTFTMNHSSNTNQRWDHQHRPDVVQHQNITYEVDHEYKQTDGHKIGSTRRKTTRRGLRKNKKGILKIAYNNMQGKLGRKGAQIANELKVMADDNAWDVILATETHRKDGAGGVPITGFNVFHRERKFDQKRGGGLAVYVRQNIRAYEWEQHADQEETHAESMWTIIPTTDGELALGLVYMGIDSSENTAWNDKIQESLIQEGLEHREQGRQILVFGDFNGHLAWQQGDGSITALDRNGRRVIAIAHDLQT